MTTLSFFSSLYQTVSLAIFFSRSFFAQSSFCLRSALLLYFRFVILLIKIVLMIAIKEVSVVMSTVVRGPRVYF